MSNKIQSIELVYRRSQIQTIVEFHQVEQPELTRVWKTNEFYLSLSSIELQIVFAIKAK